MSEVLRMSEEREQAHLNRLLDKVERAQLLRANAIVIHSDKLKEYEYFKKHYNL